MAQWGKTDNAGNSPYWGADLLKVRANSANRTALYQNTTADAFITGLTTGMFGVAANEMAAHGDNIASFTVVPGTGATVRPTVAIAAFDLAAGVNATAQAVATAVSLTINNAGTGGSYVPGNLLTFAGGTAANAATANVTLTKVRAVTTTAANGTGYANGDTVKLTTGTSSVNAVFTVTTGVANTSVASLALTTNGSFTVNPTLNSVATANLTGAGTGLTVNVVMGVLQANVVYGGNYTALPTLAGQTPTSNSATGTGMLLNVAMGVGHISRTVNGAGYSTAPAVVVTGTGLSGQSAIAVLNTGESKDVTHAGWVLRKVGSGGRAGRVQYETLVAGGSISTDVNTDDTQFPQ